MRIAVLALVSLLGCMRPMVSGGGTQQIEPCSGIHDQCYGGTGGDGGTYLAIAVGGIVFGTLAFALYRGITNSE